MQDYENEWLFILHFVNKKVTINVLKSFQDKSTKIVGKFTYKSLKMKNIRKAS